MRKHLLPNEVLAQIKRWVAEVILVCTRMKLMSAFCSICFFGLALCGWSLDTLLTAGRTQTPVLFVSVCRTGRWDENSFGAHSTPMYRRQRPHSSFNNITLKNYRSVKSESVNISPTLTNWAQFTNRECRTMFSVNKSEGRD